MKIHHAQILPLPICVALLLTGAAQGQDSTITELDAIQVSASTGSRIVRAGYQAPTPVTTLDTAELFLKTPGHIADALNVLPSLQGSISPMTFESSQANGVRGNYLNLRGLGVERTLVMHDGRRVASVEHADSAGIKRRSDRNQAADVWVRGGRGTQALPYQLYDHAAYNYLSLGGVIATGPLSGRQFVAGGDTIDFNPGTAIPGVATVSQHGEGASHTPDCCTMLPDIESNQIFARASMHITPMLSTFAQVALARTISRESGILFQRHLNQMTIHRDNPYLANETRRALADTDTFTVARVAGFWIGCRNMADQSPATHDWFTRAFTYCHLDG